ncbi:MAG: DUF1552 domain-containing protein [Opitutaceae bacterium]
MSKLSRRTFLRGSLATILLPVLEANGGALAMAATGTKIPKRLVFLAMGYGVNAQNWFPSQTEVGSDYTLPPLVESFQDLKSDISFIQNLESARLHGPHAATANFLTCANTKAVPGRFTNSISCDQVAAKALGAYTRYSSLAIGSSRGVDGHGGSLGYASWGPNGKPVGLQRSMNDLYVSLFGSGSQSKELKAKLARKESSLDALLSNAKKLNTQVSYEDRDRVDEYFTSIRNIETRLSKAQEWADTPFPDAPYEMIQKLGGKEGIELVLDMMVVALKTDSTRVMTYMLPTAPILQDIRFKGNPHRMSHQGAGELDPNKPHQQRDRAMAELASGFIRKLKTTKELDGSSVLDHTLVAYGSSLRQGHGATNGPMILAGHGGGGIKQGQNIVYKPREKHLSDLWLSMIRQAGVQQDTFANSTGVLAEMGFS